MVYYTGVLLFGTKRPPDFYLSGGFFCECLFTGVVVEFTLIVGDAGFIRELCT